MKFASVSKPIGERIKSIRLKKKISAADIAEELGMLSTSYNKIERGESNTGINTILKIAEILEVNPATLFSDQPAVAENHNKFGYATKDDLEALDRRIHDSIRKEFEKLRDELLPLKNKKGNYKKGK